MKKYFKKLILTLFVISLMSVGMLSSMEQMEKFDCSFTEQEEEKQEVGASGGVKLIIVAGPSSCGKSLITDALLKKLPEDKEYGGKWKSLSLDEVNAKIAGKVSSRGKKYWFGLQKKYKNRRLSPAYFVLIKGIKKRLDKGVNVVLDVVFDEEEGYLEEFLIQLFKKDGDTNVDLKQFSHRFLSVFLYCDFETIIERVRVRNALKKKEEERKVGHVVSCFAKMIKADFTLHRRNSLGNISVSKFKKALNTSSQLSPTTDDSAIVVRRKEQATDCIMTLMGIAIDGNPDQEYSLLPRAFYDCLVRSDEYPNKKLAENIEFSVTNIIIQLHEKFKECVETKIPESNIRFEEEGEDENDK